MRRKQCFDPALASSEFVYVDTSLAQTPSSNTLHFLQSHSVMSFNIDEAVKTAKKLESLTVDTATATKVRDALDSLLLSISHHPQSTIGGMCVAE